MTLALSWKLLSRGEDAGVARLLTLARRGDRGAFDGLRRQYDPDLKGFVVRRVGESVAGDVLQDTWIACWTSLPKFNGSARFKAWLYGIATHKCADALGGRRTESLSDIVVEPIDPHADRREAVANRHFVEDALGRLPLPQREVLELYYYAELTLAEIGQALGRNLNTVKYQFYKAHEQVAAFAKTQDGIVT